MAHYSGCSMTYPSENDYDDNDHESNTFTFEATNSKTKAILRYLTKTDKHKDALEQTLKKANMELKEISEEEIEVILLKRGEDFMDNESRKAYIKLFIESYECWNEKLECGSDLNMGKYIKSKIIPKYREQCYGMWYQDTSTIRFTGPKHIVQHIKDEITVQLKKYPKTVQLPGNSRAHSFDYLGVEVAIMRFISFKPIYHNKLKTVLNGIADVNIVQMDKTWKLQVCPAQHSLSLFHAQFESQCQGILKQFFSQFSVWKGKFDRDRIANERSRQPSLFITKDYQDHYVRWYHETGVVNVTGIIQKVSHWQKRLENLFGSSLIQSSSETAHPVHISPIYPTLASPPQPQNNRTRQRHLSSEDRNYIPQSPSRSSTVHDIQFDTDGINPGILKFVFNDKEAKINFEKLCVEIAKVSIVNDHGQIKVNINFKNKNVSNAVMKSALEQVTKYFDRFSAETKKYEASKLKNIKQEFSQLFDKEPGVFVQCFTDSGTVKVLGCKEMVEKKVKEIDHEMDCLKEEEHLPVDVFIAHRECEVWKKTEKHCLKEDHIILITSSDQGIITYKGNLGAIQRAKKVLEKLYENLIKRPVENLSQDQLLFLKKCKDSQQNSLKTKENILDDLYNNFRKNNIKGSLIFSSSDVNLIAKNENQWNRGNMILKGYIQEFEITPSNYQPDVSFIDVNSYLKKSLKDDIVHIKSQRESRKIKVFCFESQQVELQVKILNIIRNYSKNEDPRKFYKMSEEMAIHIKNHCKLDRAKTVQISNQPGLIGLFVTYEQEDLESVDMSVEDLKKEISTVTKQFFGYSLYEYLSGKGKTTKDVAELETKCSIFIKPMHQNNQVKNSQGTYKSYVSVKLGNIVDEKCDAIVISTGKSVSFSGQLVEALKNKFDSNIVTAAFGKAAVVVETLLQVCAPDGLLPWKYIFNTATPNNKDKLTEILSRLVVDADKRKIKSLALPTIGTGKAGLDSAVVVSCMKNVFGQFESQLTFLKDIRIIVYEQSQWPIFQTVATQREKETYGTLSKSTGMSVKIYGNSNGNLAKAESKIQEICDNHIKTEIITQQDFHKDEKSKIQEICNQNDLMVEWKRNMNKEEVHIQGLVDNVRKATDLIGNFLKTVYPRNWSSMSDVEVFSRKELGKGSPEYDEVERKFRESQPVVSKIIKIERVQNKTLYDQFKSYRDKKEVEYSGQNKKITRRLFHGTRSENVNKICATGFNRSFAGENGTAYGQGCYFAVKSKYSARYCRGNTKHMFLAEVVTGDYVTGNPQYKAPPEKSPSVLYDSLVDRESDPNIFVVFPDWGYYPSYVITFE